MQAVILAGGFGKRLSPVVNDVPKPMAPVAGRCFLEYLLDSMKANGIHDFILCIHHMPEKIMDYFGDGRKFGIKIRYSLEETPLGTGGAIGLLRDSIHEAFCVLNGDTYLQVNMQEFMAWHKANETIASMAIAEVGDISRYGQVITDGQDNLVEFREKNENENVSGFINAGLSILEPKIFDYIPKGRPVSFEKEVLAALLEQGKKVSTFPHVKNFFDIGIPDDYYSFQCWIADGKAPG